MYSLLKSLLKPIKYGIKYGKGISAAYSLFLHKKLPTYNTFIGQGIGMLFLPLLLIIIRPLAKKIFEAEQERFAIGLCLGVAITNALKNFLSSTVFKHLPSNIANLTSLLTVVVVFPLAAWAIPLCINKLKTFHNLPITASSVPIKYRYKLGIQTGLIIGSAIGASFSFICPSLGLLTAGIGGFLGVATGLIFATFASSLLLRLIKKTPSNSSEEKDDFLKITKSLKLGVLLGTCIGVVIGTFLLPGLGSTLGGILGAGIGGTVTGSLAILEQKLYPQHRLSLMKYLFSKESLAQTTLDTKIGIAGAGLLGSLIGTFLLPGLGTVAGGAIGSLIGCVIGVGLRIIASTVDYQSTNKLLLLSSPQYDPSCYKAKKVAFSLGSSIGSLIGAAIGSFVPVVGTILGGFIGTFFGGAIGLVASAFYNCTAKNKITMESTQELPLLMQSISLFSGNVSANDRSYRYITSCTDKIPETIASSISKLEQPATQLYAIKDSSPKAVVTLYPFKNFVDANGNTSLEPKTLTRDKHSFHQYEQTKAAIKYRKLPEYNCPEKLTDCQLSTDIEQATSSRDLLFIS